MYETWSIKTLIAKTTALDGKRQVICRFLRLIASYFMGINNDKGSVSALSKDSTNNAILFGFQVVEFY
jgi:hypothetical protein